MSESLLIDYRHRDRLPDISRKMSFRGFSAEHVRMSQPNEYGLAWVGSRHYVALHDMMLRDSRMTVDGLPSMRATDLRDRMTYLPPGCSISGWSQQQDRVNSFTMLYFDPEVMEEETAELFRGRDAFAMALFKDARLGVALLRLQRLLLADPSAADAIEAETASLLTIAEIARLQSAGEAPATGRQGGLSLARERLVRDFVEANLDRDVSLDELSRVAGLSRFHFARAFRETTGVPPHSYVLSRRTERAKTLLSRSTLSLAEIAQAAGFGSPAQFSKTFRAQTGVTPGVYRRGL